MLHQRPETAGSNLALPDVPVAVTPGTPGVTGVVGVYQYQALEADELLNPIHKQVDSVSAGDVITGGVEMAGIEAYA